MCFHDCTIVPGTKIVVAVGVRKPIHVVPLCDDTPPPPPPPHEKTAKHHQFLQQLAVRRI